MNTLEVGKKLVELCSAGKNMQAMEALYSPDIVSIEAGAPPGAGSPEKRGMADVMAKAKWWAENHEIHSAKCEGPWPHGDRFIVRFTYDITNKPANRRMQLDESALYYVKDGKIVREEFFYAM